MKTLRKETTEKQAAANAACFVMGFFLGSFLKPEDGGDFFHRNDH
jgi:hypothetical protein